jgi:hypothetical protein
MKLYLPVIAMLLLAMASASCNAGKKAMIKKGVADAAKNMA